MKNSILATGIALALASPLALAGGIQIDPTGSGSVGSSKFLSDSSLGSSFGAFLATNILSGYVGGSSTIQGQNSFGLTSFGIPGMSLTVVYSLSVTPTTTCAVGGCGTAGSALSFALSGGTQSFAMYLTPTGNISASAGTGYSTGTLIASTSAITLTGLGGTAGLTETTAGLAGDLSANGAYKTVQTIGSNGSIYLNMDFAPSPSTDVNANYIVNDLTSLAVDLTTLNALTTPFPPGTTSPAKVNGVTPTFGTIDPKGSNAFNCVAFTGLSTNSGTCDFMANMNTTFVIPAQQVPEPTTLALLGAGLSLVGFSSRRRRAKKS